jgi:hypothetical protein
LDWHAQWHEFFKIHTKQWKYMFCVIVQLTKSVKLHGCLVLRICECMHTAIFLRRPISIHSGKFSAERKFCKMWLADANFPSENYFRKLKMFNF